MPVLLFWCSAFYLYSKIEVYLEEAQGESEIINSNTNIKLKNHKTILDEYSLFIVS
ncbi:hypothetical protein LX97_02256 [Nonlabens dokdonensis]|uniref:Uncharacterized protein n=2 Tax=Nonlabens dokdonensis TaxID=328515 RepID=L7WF72_NONDD|nr:hypothetical protein DDD_2421 [Nonlabens dokdonensis DSW-6]PZX39898.1 hypothetical protein LX97_02256 [Nonlabens dokdonensis]